MARVSDGDDRQTSAIVFFVYDTTPASFAGAAFAGAARELACALKASARWAGSPSSYSHGFVVTLTGRSFHAGRRRTTDVSTRSV
jgi:hypothetical protein